MEITQNGTTEILPDSGYDGLSKVTVTTDIPTGGDETEEVAVDLSMADGDQVITPSSGKSISKATITKPGTLIPANIKKDIVIGGVTGSFDGISPSDLLLFGSATDGDGCIIASLDKLDIKVWGKGTYDTSYADTSYSQTPYLQKITSPSLLPKLNAIAEYLLTGSPSPLDSIFSAADAVEYCGVVFDKPSYSTITEKTWDNLMNALAFPSSWVGPKYINPTKWYTDNGEVDYSAATFPMIWYPVYETTGQRLYAYSIQTPTGTMPTYDTGAKIVNGLGIAFINAMPAYGVTANVVAAMFMGVIFWYSYGAMTIPEALMKQFGSDWSYGDVTLSEGWNQTLILSDNATTTAITEQQAYDHFADAYEGGLPIDNYNSAVYGLSDYEKSVFKPIYKADYYRSLNPLKIELNIVKTTT